jgi:hypothetical protein
MFQPLRVLWRPSTYLRWWFPFGVRSVGCLIKTITNQTTAVPLPTTVLSDDSLTVLPDDDGFYFSSRNKSITVTQSAE